MRPRPTLLAAALGTALLVSATTAEDEGPAPKPADAPPGPRTVLVELFTSQG
jgi:hypothetical protein